MWGSSGDRGKSLAAMVPALVLGLAAGVTGGIGAAGAMDTTPYDETDFNTVSRDARQAGSTAGWQQANQAADAATARLKAANAEDVGRLEDRLAEMRATRKQADKQTKKDSAEQEAKLARLQGSLAEATAALGNATGEGGSGAADGQTVDGTLKSRWVLGPDDKPWPQDCAKPLQDYQVRVTAGAGATVAVARLVDAEVVKASTEPDTTKTTKTTKKNTAKRAAKNDTGVLVCSMTYSATLPTPLGDGYQAIVVDTSQAGTPLQTKAASRSSLGDGSGPTLSVSR